MVLVLSEFFKLSTILGCGIFSGHIINLINEAVQEKTSFDVRNSEQETQIFEYWNQLIIIYYNDIIM